MSVLKIKDQNNDWIQIPTIKGDKGEPFTYADFTPEQLESLKGKDGISPTVSVASDTSEDYRLSFTDETHTVTTPNLIPEAEKIFDVYPTDTASGSIASFPDGADDIPLKSCIVQVEPVQEGSGDPSPDNVRAITGWTGAKVTRCGKNLLEPKFYRGIDYNKKVGDYLLYGQGLVDDSQNVTQQGETYSRTGNSWYMHMSMLIDVEKLSGIPICVSGSFTGELNINNGLRSAWCFVDKNFIVTRVSNTMNIPLPYNLTPVDGEKYLVWYINSSRSGTIELNCPMIELGSTATEYEPYQGNNYPITFPSEAGTVYGAYVDVINGELVVNRAQIASYNGETLPSTWISDRDVYASGTTPTIGAQVVYKLAEPIHYSITSNQINSLYGQNNLWANTGDTSVTYRADTTLYIKRLTDSDTNMVADANITSGSYFMVGNDLYRATVNIASGAQVIEGTNATKVSLATALNEINA